MSGGGARILDLETAMAMADSFARVTGIRCRLLSAQGNTLYQYGTPEDECTYFKTTKWNYTKTRK